MTVPKSRAAVIVFVIGFALGLSVFASSRLLVRSVLGADMEGAAVELASRLAGQGPVEATGRLSSVVRYAVFGSDGKLVRSVDLAPSRESPGDVPASSMHAAVVAAERGAPVVEHAQLLPALLGLIEPGVRGAAAPLIENGVVTGAVYVETDQASALASLTRAFSIVGIMAVSLAVLASVAITRAVTRGRGGSGRAFRAGPNSRDPETGLPNRSGFIGILGDATSQAAQADQQIGLMIVDLDGFRAVNNVWGHQVGDAVLRVVAERLGTFARRPDCLSRVGADQFAIIVDTEANSHGLRQLAERIREALSTPVKVGDSAIAVGASIGAALFPVNADSAEMLFRAADTALSKAKQEGRNTLAFFDTEMKKRMLRRTVLERDLRQALERDEFVVFYQPQMELASGRVRGYEALVRWERPGEGILSPREFLPVAEETGLIRPLGQWVLRKACTDAAGWTDGSIVAVNFSAAQFRFQELDARIAEVLAETGLPAARLEIEVPESLFLEHSPEVMGSLTRIKALGVRVAMDDFGSGYSGLASLAQFPFDKIKIDRSFVGQLTEDADVAAIVASIVGLGRSLSVDITAEGVETQEQVTLLKAAGCSIVQGFLFGVPQRGAQGAADDTPATPAEPRDASAVG
jgi:diguanylate cyclase (GGDEF)-like protein